MNKWLYHAAGTAGIVGGVLLLGAGGAHADDRNEDVNALLGEVFSPTRGLSPLDLPAGLPLGGSPLDALGGSPLDSLGSPLDSLGGSPLDAAGLSDIALGAGLPIPSELVQLDGDPIGLPTRFANTDYRTLPGSVQPPYTGYHTLPAPATQPPHTGYRTLPAPAPLSAGQVGEEAGPPEVIGPMPYLTDPLTRSLLGGRSLGDLAAIGDPTAQIPVAGPMVSQTTRNLPLVSDIIPGRQNRTMPMHPQSLPVADADPLSQASPIGDDQLPPVIAQQLAAEGGYSPELLGGGGLPLIGPALDPVTQMIGVGDLPSQVPVVGPLAKPVLSGLPVVGSPAPAAPAGPAVPGSPTSPTELPGGPIPHPGTAVAERPIAGEDPEYTESLI